MLLKTHSVRKVSNATLTLFSFKGFNRSCHLAKVTRAPKDFAGLTVKDKTT